jgi:hypothetical protein
VSLAALRSETQDRPEGALVALPRLTRPTAGKSFVQRGVDTQRPAGLTRFIFQSRIVWGVLGPWAIGNAPKGEGERRVGRGLRRGRA